MKIEVDAMTAMVEGFDVEEPHGSVIGWGLTHWDGPDAGGKLYRAYMRQEKIPGGARHWYEIYVEGQMVADLPKDANIRQWALDKGWRPVVTYSATYGNVVGYAPLPE